MIDTRPQRLRVLREQLERRPVWQQDAVADAFGVADSFVERLDEIANGRYRTDRETELTIEARGTCVRDLGLVYDAIDRACETEREAGLDAFDGDRNTRAREGRTLADVVDVADFASDDARRVKAAVETAAYFGLEGEARRLALTHVKPRAADEVKRHRQSGPWFAALCALSEGTLAPNDRHAVAMRTDGIRQQLRQVVKQIADILGVANELTRTQTQQQRPAPMPENVKPSTYSVGRYFDLHPPKVRS